MSIVLERGKKPRLVRNLGWLVRHGNALYCRGFGVKRFVITHRMPKQLALSPFPQHAELYMIAYMRNGKTFMSKWADLEICMQWLGRRVLPAGTYPIRTQFCETPVRISGELRKRLKFIRTA